MRAAAAEVEDYTRVTVISDADEAVAAPAVTDMIHLLAELIENATLFSPSTTRVEVRAERVANGFAIEVEDRGLGIPADQLVALNAQLADPPDFDLADADRLGLFVAGRLAARHGVHVSLPRPPTGAPRRSWCCPTASSSRGRTGGAADRPSSGRPAGSARAQRCRRSPGARRSARSPRRRSRRARRMTVRRDRAGRTHDARAAAPCTACPGGSGRAAAAGGRPATRSRPPTGPRARHAPRRGARAGARAQPRGVPAEQLATEPGADDNRIRAGRPAPPPRRATVTPKTCQPQGGTDGGREPLRAAALRQGSRLAARRPGRPGRGFPPGRDPVPDGLLIAASKDLSREDAEHLSAVAAAMQSLAAGTGDRFDGGRRAADDHRARARHLLRHRGGRGQLPGRALPGRRRRGPVAYEMAMLVKRARPHLAALPRFPATEIPVE